MDATGLGELIGSSALMIDLREEVDRIGKSDAKVLLTGERGVGKELVARAIHARSARAASPLLTMNCAGLPDTLLEWELFGHGNGSLKGGSRDLPGKLELANRGTILLGKIGEMTLRMQGLLLRFLETGELHKTDAPGLTTPINVRVMASASGSLRQMMALGTFREDLFYRLNVIHVEVPALRQHPEDVPELVVFFLEQFTRTGLSLVRSVSSDALGLMQAYSWPGNVGELANVIQGLVATGRHEIVRPEDLPAEIRIPGNPDRRRERRRTVADDLFEKLIAERESFWTSVYPLYMQREITRGHVRDVIRKGLEEAHGNYKMVAQLFNMEQRDYKRFLSFLRKHDCHVPFAEYR